MQADLAVPSETKASPFTGGAEFERIAACAGGQPHFDLDPRPRQ
jgi:hypothetical protein